MQLAQVNNSQEHPAELDMDQHTKQLFEAQEQLFEQKLRPLIDSQREIQVELREQRNGWVDLRVDAEKLKSQQERLRQDLNNGLTSIRREAAMKWKILTPTITAVATLLTGVVVYWLRT